MYQTYLKYTIPGTTLLLGPTKKLITHTTKQMDVDPQFQGETMKIGDWRTNDEHFDNMLGDGVLNFTKRARNWSFKMASRTLLKISSTLI
jgi:hypothetical protein